MARGIRGLYPKEVGLPFNCNIRYDSVNQHAADLLERAGCYGAAVGLESGNQYIREVVIRKQSKNDHIIEGARLLREKGIKVLTTNMIGLPGETLDNALETVELNMVLKSDYVRANTFLLFPGLPLVEHARQKGYVDKDFDIALRGPVTGHHAEHAVREGIQEPGLALLAHGEIHAAVDPVLPALGGAARQHPVPHHRVVQHGAGAAVLPVRPIPALRYFHNTVLMTRRSGLSMTMRTIPALFRKGTVNTPAPREVVEANRGHSDVHDGGIGPAIPDAPLPGMAAARAAGTLAWLLLR